MVKDFKRTNWQTKKLGEVCEIGTGNSAPQKNECFIDGIYPFFRTSDIGKIHIGGITISSDYLNKKGIKGLKLFNKGTILLPKSGASTFLNHRVVLGVDGYVSSHLATIKTNEKVLNNNYLFYFLQEVKAQDLIQDHKYPSLNLPVIGNIEISYPESLPEQHRIVKILDEVFADVAKAKENAEKNLQNSKELFESYLYSVFASPGKDWEEKKLKEIGITQTGTTPKTAVKENYGNFIPFIKPADVDFSGVGDIRYNNDGLSEIGLKKGRKMNKGSTLMVCIGATIGKVGFAEQLVSCNQQINSLTVKDEYEPKFFYYAMTSKEFQKKVLSEGKGAQATLPIINKSKWENLTIVFPISKIEQKSIVARLDTLSAETKKLEEIYKQKLAILEELKKSFLQKAFSGEL